MKTSLQDAGTSGQVRIKNPQEAEDDLEHVFNYYEQQRSGLRGEMVDEFRRSLEHIMAHVTISDG